MKEALDEDVTALIPFLLNCVAGGPKFSKRGRDLRPMPVRASVVLPIMPIYQP